LISSTSIISSFVQQLCTASRAVVTLAEEVMFSAASVGQLVSLVFVSRITEKNYSTDLHNTRWKGGTWDAEEAVRF